ncbi:NAD(P)/FAD-dependent oxidoreductase [Pseudarthrobacter sp. fls2-241-R2A-168]|uniref:flavin-containing monooxygenase n=1 Tax=Pseudarthrobacter sp. fls2-241-R2A-168 TaxID=3040304 RepID=UPI0025552461|nr:NAD(P)/FAD-dependent oxidoreductase [Pseudarthrobacter sp. fls2-241-R2A-168]
MFFTAQFHTATEPATIDELRAKYGEERDRRIRPEGPGQYRSTGGNFGFYAVDPYSEKTMRQPVSDRVEVLVIGAGFGGLLTAARLREAGVESIRLMDEAGDVGGTWYWNRYPGIHCDIESYVYMPLLEEVGYVPSWRYAPGEEIRQHAIAVAKRFDLYRDTLFHTRATGLKWNEEADEWAVETDRGDRFRARYVVTSSGTLTQPKLPNIPGIETFRGHTFHTSRWDYGYTGGTAEGGLVGLADKRVAVVGTGATGVQVIPHLGRDAQQLLVFQRTPSTIDVRDNRPTDLRWAASLGPGWQRERMENFLEVLSGEPVTESLVNDGWTRTVRLQRKFLSGSVDKSLSDDEREARDELADWEVMARIRARVDEIVDNPETAELLKPWYRYMCKRPCFSDTYLQTFNRPNVTLVDTASTGGITRMTETSIVVGDAEYEVDCVIFATGFDVGVSGILSGTLPVAGRDGKSLLAAWGEGPRTLHGFYTYGFPNLFNLGVMQNANSVNYAHILQEQAEHIAAVIQAARDTLTGVVEPSPESEEAWCAHIAKTATSDGGFLAECTPGYYNGEGTRVASPTTYSPGPVAFHHLLRHWRQESMQDVLRSSPAGGKARRVHAGPKAAG